MADLFIEHVFRLHGLPDSIISDRRPQIAATFWQRLFGRLGIENRLSTAFNPEADGQTEWAIAVMEQNLRAHVSYLQEDWSTGLPIAGSAVNNQASETTGVSLFFGMYG